MTYSTLGKSCKPLTIALTSNQKFIMPYAPVYCKCCSNMTLYPGRNPHCCIDPVIQTNVVNKKTCKSCTGR